MDRSVDSIGSCSLDVDADSSDVSDTSGSLNFATPLSAKDITREFTAKIAERCQLSQNTTTYLDLVSGQVHTIVTPTEKSAISPEKKPSYLNLACCVSGYSNLTTYDSKVRQDINKSREVSPIRPSTTSIQHCKKNNSLAPPIIISTNKSLNNSKITMTSNQYLNDSIGSSDMVNMADIADAQYSSPQQSFIQQRVERLYGPGALAQVFYSPKKIKSKFSNTTILHERSSNIQTEFCKKYQQLSSNRYLSVTNKSSHESTYTPSNSTTATDVTDHSVNNSFDLPVLRHLSQEFRAQLPSISPKHSYMKTSHSSHSNIASPTVENNINGTQLHNDLDSKGDSNEGDLKPTSSTETSAESLILATEKVPDGQSNKISKIQENDGNYFLDILKQEQNRLLELAHRAEKYISSLENNADISEEVLGLLRAASGKARLLVSQKMKQFEGLCHNNLNRSPEDAFPTTIEDLQGFWDMVYLQVEHIDSIFEEIEELKNNDWKLKPMVDETCAKLPVKPQKVISVSKTTGSKQKPSIINGSTHINGRSATVNMSAAALKREAQRKQLMEIKRKNKMAMHSDNVQTKTATAIEIFVNENNS